LSVGTEQTSSAEPSELLKETENTAEITTESTTEKGHQLQKPEYFSTLEKFGTIRRLKREGKARMVAYASAMSDRLDLQVEADKFYDWHVAKHHDGPLGPVTSWRNWLDKALKIAMENRRRVNGNRAANGKPGGHPASDSDAAEDMRRRQQQMANERGVAVGGVQPEVPHV